MREAFGFAGFVVFTFVLFGLGFREGWDEGAKAVASGKYTCALIESPDKTTEWVCERSAKP